VIILQKTKTERNEVARVTVSLLQIIFIFLENPKKYYVGMDIINHTKLQSGTIYPLLNRLCKMGWLEFKWKLPDPDGKGSPKKLYNVTKTGATDMLNILETTFSKSVSEKFKNK